VAKKTFRFLSILPEICTKHSNTKSMEFGRIIISETASNSENPQDVIHSNISVINLMREENR
jgi:hypothetical protein